MARPKQKWTSEEEEALAAGVEKFGLGKWKNILDDPQFASSLANRTNVDLKDKWRNLSGNDYGSRSRGNARTPGQVINSLLLTYAEPSRTSVERRRNPPYKTMIYEALSSIEDPNGTDINTMVGFLEPKYESPKNFRRILTSNLRKLVLNGDLQKVNHRYKVKDMSSGAETSQLDDVCTNTVDNCNEEHVESLLTETPEDVESLPLETPEDVEPLPLGTPEDVEPLLTETLEDAADAAAFLVSVAETMEERLIKICEDRDKLAELLEESTAMLTLAEELHRQCIRDELVIPSP